MADDSDQPLVTAETAAEEKKEAKKPPKQQRKGFLSRIWNGVFRVRGDDFEKRLKYISKEEASLVARMKKRSQSWRRTARNLIIFSVTLEVIAVGYAIMTTRALDLNWRMRALRVLPMFLLPALSSIIYTALMSFTKMCDRKDQKSLERLRAERQAKIDELKERTNYYTTQQLIQRYDPDPAAKAAAASVLASKLGADSGLKVYVGEEAQMNSSSGKSNDIEYAQAKGLRNRKRSHTRSSSTGSLVVPQTIEEMSSDDSETRQNQTVVEHHPNSTVHDGGWIARIAALLVGEDPTQSYALICGSCHMHNGLARKEDFPYITYYCPHCHALNKSRQVEEPPVPNSMSISCPVTPTDDDAGSPLTESKPSAANAIAAEETVGAEDKVFEPVSQGQVDT